MFCPQRDPRRAVPIDTHYGGYDWSGSTGRVPRDSCQLGEGWHFIGVWRNGNALAEARELCVAAEYIPSEPNTAMAVRFGQPRLLDWCAGTVTREGIEPLGRNRIQIAQMISAQFVFGPRKR